MVDKGGAGHNRPRRGALARTGLRGQRGMSVGIRDAVRERGMPVGGWSQPSADFRLPLVFEHAAVPIALTDVSGRIIAANTALCESIGLPLSQASVHSLVHPLQPGFAGDAGDGKLANWPLVAATDTPAQFDCPLVVGSGRRLWVRVDVRPGPLLSRASMTGLRTEDSSANSMALVVTIQDITERRQAEEALDLLTARKLQTQDEERRRIASELHGVTAQNLSALIMALSRQRQLIRANERAAQRILEECQTLSADALNEVRTLSYTLHPPLLDEVGLIPWLQWYVNGFSARSGIAVQFTAPPKMARLSLDVETALFRVMQECLTNVQRHSDSKSARISLTRAKGHVVLRVSDRGHGIGHGMDGAESHQVFDGIATIGVGIAGMRQRLHQLGGSVEIRSSKRGTRIIATVPIVKESKHG